MHFTPDRFMPFFHRFFLLALKQLFLLACIEATFGLCSLLRANLLFQ